MQLRRILETTLAACIGAIAPQLAHTETALTASSTPHQTLVLAGGHLPLCASSNPAACKSDRWQGLPGYQAPQYRLDTQDLSKVLAVLPEEKIDKQALLAFLQALKKRCKNQTFSRDALVQQIDLVAKRMDDKAIWTKLLDDEQDGVLSAFEITQLDSDGVRVKERVDLNASDPKIVEIYRRFVREAAQASGKQRPLILVVTASSRDVFASVDYYLAALEQAGAQVQWLPLDPAMLTAKNSEDLISARTNVLGVLGRERVYPDLHDQQLIATSNKTVMLDAIRAADGVFLNGGDQSLMVRAWFESSGSPNPYWLALKAKLSAGELVLGGTSAGTAVQSGRGLNAAMLTGGASWSGLSLGAQQVLPQEFGCARANRCETGAEDALTFSAKGGLGSFPFAVLDTHFSERGRQWRMAALLRDPKSPRFGLGVDEATAVVATWPVGSTDVETVRLESIGHGEGWWFERQSTGDLNLRAVRAGDAWQVSPLVASACPESGTESGTEADTESGKQPARVQTKPIRIDNAELAQLLRSDSKMLRLSSADARAKGEVLLCRQGDFWRWQWLDTAHRRSEEQL